jgi:hypothetical protein
LDQIAVHFPLQVSDLGELPHFARGLDVIFVPATKATLHVNNANHAAEATTPATQFSENCMTISLTIPFDLYFRFDFVVMEKTE